MIEPRQKRALVVTIGSALTAIVLIHPDSRGIAFGVLSTFGSIISGSDARAFATLLVGVMGFTGVIWSLRRNSSEQIEAERRASIRAQEERDRLRKETANSLAAAMRAELTTILKFIEYVSETCKTIERTLIKHEVNSVDERQKEYLKHVISLPPVIVYKSNVDKIGIFDAQTAEYIVRIYAEIEEYAAVSKSGLQSYNEFGDHSHDGDVVSDLVSSVIKWLDQFYEQDKIDHSIGAIEAHLTTFEFPLDAFEEEVIRISENNKRNSSQELQKGEEA